MNKIKKVNEPNGADYFTVDETAKELGIKPTAIRNYLSWGRFTTYKFKTLTLIKREEIEEWKKRQK